MLKIHTLYLAIFAQSLVGVKLANTLPCINQMHRCVFYTQDRNSSFENVSGKFSHPPPLFFSVIICDIRLFACPLQCDTTFNKCCFQSTPNKKSCADWIIPIVKWLCKLIIAFALIIFTVILKIRYKKLLEFTVILTLQSRRLCHIHVTNFSK